jgi:valyl-tRNA synthetase
LEQFIDVDAELSRLERLLGQIVKQITGKQQKLGNESFVSRAPQQVVEQERQSLEDLKSSTNRIEQRYREIEGSSQQIVCKGNTRCRNRPVYLRRRLDGLYGDRF